jgi:hypothetical protein
VVTPIETPFVSTAADALQAVFDLYTVVFRQADSIRSQRIEANRQRYCFGVVETVNKLVVRRFVS